MTTEAAAFTAYLFIEEITPRIGWHISAQLLKVPKRHAFEDENAFVNWLCNLTIRLYRYLLVKIKKEYQQCTSRCWVKLLTLMPRYIRRLSNPGAHRVQTRRGTICGSGVSERNPFVWQPLLTFPFPPSANISSPQKVKYATRNATTTCLRSEIPCRYALLLNFSLMICLHAYGIIELIILFTKNHPPER